MKMRGASFIFLFFFICFSPLSGFTVPGVPRIPQAPAPLAGSGVWIQTINDSFGSVWADEWDDLRSFGFRGGVKLNGGFLFSCEYAGLTFRGERESDGLRADTLSFSAGWEFASLRTDLIALSSAAGLGGTVWGNLGGHTIQYNWHAALNVHRPIPVMYDPGTFFHPFAYGSLSIVFLLPVAVELALYGTFHSSVNATAAGEAMFWFLDRDFSLYAGARLQLSTPYGFSPTAEEVHSKEKGVWLQSGLTAGIFSLESSYNVSTGISTGTLGVSLCGPPSRPYPRSQDTGLPQKDRPDSTPSARGLPHKLPPQRITAELGVPLPGNYSIYRLAWQPAFLYRGGPLAKRLSAFFAYENGWAKRKVAEEQGVRFQQITAGGMFSSSPPRFGTLVTLFLRAGLGWHEEKQYILNAARAEPYAEAYRAVHTAGIGIRFRLHPPFAGSSTVHYGFSVSGNYRLPLFTAAEQYSEMRGLPLEPELFFSLSMVIATVPP